MRLISYGLSDIGLSRLNNEDVWAAHPDLGFFVLADGMGGQNAGEIAAKEAVDYLTSQVRGFERADGQTIAGQIRRAIEHAGRWVHGLSKQSEELSGMGTTLCCLLWMEDAIVYAHIGDSRIYRLRNKKLELLTEDHSLFAKWHALDEKASECKTPFPYKNVITRALGTSRKARPEVNVADHEWGDLYFLSSDGLHDVLSLSEMESAINDSKNLEAACFDLIEMAKFKGSSDNITLLMVQSDQSDAKDLFR